MKQRVTQASLADAWFTAGGALKAVVPSARLDVLGTGIEMDIRPGPQHERDVAAVRHWLLVTMPGLRRVLRPGYQVRHDQPERRRRG